MSREQRQLHILRLEREQHLRKMDAMVDDMRHRHQQEKINRAVSAVITHQAIMWPVMWFGAGR